MNYSGTLRCGTGWGSECMLVRRTYCVPGSGFGVGAVRGSAVRNDFGKDHWPSSSGFWSGCRRGEILSLVLSMACFVRYFLSVSDFGFGSFF